MMNKTKLTALLLAAALISVFAAGCTMLVSASQQAEATETPQPTEVPLGMTKLFGKEIAVALWSDDAGFTRGAEAQAEALGMTLTPVDSAKEAAEYDLVLVCSADYEPEKLEVPAVLFTTDEEAVPENGCGIIYQRQNEIACALDALYHYPSHEAPIRMLALYEQEGSPAASECNLMAQQGKLHIKGESSGENAKQTALDMLDKVTVGLLDTLFTENAELAMQAFEALKEAQRGDAVEVITCGLNEQIVEAMIEEHFLMGAASGPNMWSAGSLALRMGLTLLAGESVENCEMQPYTLYSDDVIAAFREGVTEAEALLLGADPQLEELYQNDVVDYMQQYYGG